MNRSNDTPDRSVLLKELEALSLRLELEEAEMIALLPNTAIEQELSALTLNSASSVDRGQVQILESGSETTATDTLIIGGHIADVSLCDQSAVSHKRLKAEFFGSYVTAFAQMAVRLFQFLSKTDQDALSSGCCTKVTRMTQTSLGIMVLLTGILAFFSGSYAIYTAFAAHNWAPLAAVPLGVLYSFMIIMFDREIVGAQDKRAVWIRLPLAFVIGFIVAVPLELRLLEDSINKQLFVASQRENKESLARMKGKQDELDARKTELRESINRYRGEVKRWNEAMEAETAGRQLAGRTGKSGQGPAYREAEQNHDASAATLARYEADLRKHEEMEEQERRRFLDEYKTAYIPQATDFLSRYEALDQLKSNSGGAFAISWGLIIFFILIEVFPALLKLFLPYNEYNAIVEARMRIQVQRVHAIGKQQLDGLAQNPPSYPQTSLLDALNNQP